MPRYEAQLREQEAREREVAAGAEANEEPDEPGGPEADEEEKEPPGDGDGEEPDR